MATVYVFSVLAVLRHKGTQSIAQVDHCIYVARDYASAEWAMIRAYNLARGDKPGYEIYVSEAVEINEVGEGK